MQNLRPSGVFFSKVFEKFQIAREKVVVTVTTTFKSGGGDIVTYKVAPMLQRRQR